MDMNSIIILSAMVLGGAVAFSAGSSSPLYGVPLKDINGKPTSLKTYQGKTVLIVNVASKCGFTKQYTALEKVYRDYKGKGLVILGFPCNDFGAQEPGTNEEIKEFCSSTYEVTFPMFDKLHVKGAEQHPLYAMLTGTDAAFPGDVRWNFEKFLISPDGTVVERFVSKVTPDSPEMISAIEGQLQN